MSKKTPVDYAEITLGVHDVYAEAVKTQSVLTGAQSRVVAATRERRHTEELLAETEQEVIAELRAKYADVSDTAFQRLAKQELVKDKRMRDLRDKHREAQAGADLAEAEQRAAEFQLRLLTARMNEIGGLLFFYGAAKMASTQARKPGSETQT
jgi:hypothetical protein